MTYAAIAAAQSGLRDGLGPDLLPPRWPVLDFDGLDRQRDESDARPRFTASDSDGVYGRFDGTVTVSPGLGVEHASSEWAPALSLRAHYLSTVGIRFSHSEGRWWPAHQRSSHAVSSLGLEAMPLFLLRWSQGWQNGPGWLDLAIDSLALGAGAYYCADLDGARTVRGLAWHTGLGFPIALKGNGPWLGGELDWRWARANPTSPDSDIAFMVRFEWVFATDRGESERSSP